MALNEELSKPQLGTPVSDVLRLLQRLAEIQRKSENTVGRKAKSLCKQVNQLLSRHKWSPGVAPDLDVFIEFPQFPSRTKQIYTDVSIWLLLGALPSGEVSRFRSCHQCQTWFCGRTEHQRFCRDACRKKYASQSAEYRQKRRMYMRRYRLRETEMNQRSALSVRKDNE